jgi:TRAP-type C4-dicarboxylate transport system substrate-binding protein
MPFLQVRSEIATQALHDVWKKGYFDKEYADVKLLRFNTSASADDLLTIEPVNTLADFQGVKIASGGGGKMDLLKTLGAVPVFAPPPEQYAMLQKGIVGGIFNSGYGLYLDNTAEFLRYLISPIRMFRVIHVVAMNKDAYNKMPDDVKQIIDTMDADAKYSLMGAKVLSDEYEVTINEFLSTVGTQIDLNEADVAILEAACADIFNNWIATNEAEGWPAGKVVAEYYNNLKALGVEKPAMGYTP